jgi:hypothetical protein
MKRKMFSYIYAGFMYLYAEISDHLDVALLLFVCLFVHSFFRFLFSVAMQCQGGLRSQHIST